MKIGVVGSGIAGLGAAWLLDGRHDVVLFESEQRLGGHAHTVDVDFAGRKLPIDFGAQHFSAVMCPTVLRLFRALDVSVIPSPQTAILYDQRNGRTIPFGPAPTLGCLKHLVRPSALGVLTRLGLTIRAGQALESAGDWGVSVREFLRGQGMAKAYDQGFLLPLLSAISGMSFADTQGLSARALLGYIVRTLPKRLLSGFGFLEVEGGTGAYVRTLAASLTTTEVRLASRIQAVRVESDGIKLTAENGQECRVDRLIVAAPPHAAAKMLDSSPLGAELGPVLRRFSYMNTRIAVHSDTSRLPRDRQVWSGTNAIYDGTSCEFSIWSGRRFGADLFKSWVNFAPTPDMLHATQEYRHVIPTLDYFHAQAELRGMQGRHGIWLAGSYTFDMDSHESGLRSSLVAVHGLDPGSPRYASLCEAA